jgi:hypothetical protein
MLGALCFSVVDDARREPQHTPFYRLEELELRLGPGR